MKIDLTDTTSSKINNALVQGRRAIGTPAIGMVLTLVIVTDEENALRRAAGRPTTRPGAPLAHPRRHQAGQPLAARPRQGPARRRGAGRQRTPAPARRCCCGCTATVDRPRPVGGAAAAAAGRPGRGLVAGRRPGGPGRGPAGRARPAPDHRRLRRRAPDPGAVRRAPRPTRRATRTCPGPGSRPWRSMLAAALDQQHVARSPRPGRGRGVQPQLRAARHVAGRPAEGPGRPARSPTAPV